MSRDIETHVLISWSIEIIFEFQLQTDDCNAQMIGQTADQRVS